MSTAECMLAVRRRKGGETLMTTSSCSVEQAEHDRWRHVAACTESVRR